MDVNTISALRQTLVRASAAGWKHTVYDVAGDREHLWQRPVGAAKQRVSLYAGFVSFDPDRDDMSVRTWTVPAESVKQITAVLELAGALPAECGCLAYDLVGNPHAPNEHTSCASTTEPCGGCDSCISAQAAHYRYQERVAAGGGA